MLRYLLLLTFLFSGCSVFQTESSIPVREPIDKFEDKGPSVQLLRSAKQIQENGTNVIRTEAGKITATTKEKDTKVSAEKILDANSELTGNVKIFIDVTDNKEEMLLQIRTLEKRNEALVGDVQKIGSSLDETKAALTKSLAETESMIKTVSYWMYCIGMIGIAAGIFFCFRSGPEFLWISAAGAALIAGVYIADWLRTHMGYILLVISIGGVVMFARIYRVNRKAAAAAVKACEQTKLELQEADPKRAEKLFGKFQGGGTIQMDDASKKIIADERKRIYREWAPAAKAASAP